ncbi:MAG: MCE family protein [Solirubrobacterales bacterium]|nr:MCE family protein [Solirubrobacterales bacterium]
MLRAAFLAALACVVVLLGFLIFGGDGGHKYKLEFQTAGLIVPGNQVMVGGHPIGSVDSVELNGRNLAEMEITLDQPIHEGTTAIIRKSSLSSVHNHYVSLTPGADNLPLIPEGSTLGGDQTTTAVELDQIFDIFDEKTRKGWSDWIQGTASIYAGAGAEGANKTFKYNGPAFSSTQRLMAELSDQDAGLDKFVKNTSGLMTTLASESDTLTDLVSNANTALGAIASENESLSLALRELPPTLRQGNTTLVNLRFALDDLRPFVAASGRGADAGLARFLRDDLRPVLVRAKPVFSNLATAASKPGPNNDLNDVLTSLKPLHRVAQPSVDAVVGALDASQEDTADLRAYAPDVLNAFAKLGAISGNYDANGHYLRARQSSSPLYQFDGTEINPNTGAVYGGLDFLTAPTRCPGGATQPIAGSNPFLDDGNLVGKCDPGDVPPP